MADTRPEKDAQNIPRDPPSVLGVFMNCTPHFQPEHNSRRATKPAAQRRTARFRNSFHTSVPLAFPDCERRRWAESDRSRPASRPGGKVSSGWDTTGHTAGGESSGSSLFPSFRGPRCGRSLTELWAEFQEKRLRLLLYSSSPEEMKSRWDQTRGGQTGGPQWVF